MIRRARHGLPWRLQDREVSWKTLDPGGVYLAGVAALSAAAGAFGGWAPALTVLGGGLVILAVVLTASRDINGGRRC